MEHWWCDTDMKIEVVGEKPVPVPLFTPQTQHGLALNCDQLFVMRGQKITTLAMSQGPFCTERDVYVMLCVMLKTLEHHIFISALLQPCVNLSPLQITVDINSGTIRLNLVFYVYTKVFLLQISLWFTSG